MKQFKKILFLLLLVFGVALVGCTDDEKEPEYERNTEYTDALKLTTDYAGKSFIEDGIGLVELYQCVDGDTAHFRDTTKTGYGSNFTARFLCINTPESTGRIDPWGKAASKFVGDILKSAVEIVCESKEVGKHAEVDETQKRYLAYVWYKPAADADFRLLNLELVEEGYTKFTDVSTEVKYGETFQKAHLKSYALKIRDYGELDPDFDYSGEVKEITIAEIRKNIDDYTGGTKIRITARVMRLVGDNMYLQDLAPTWDEETQEYVYGSIYMFSGYGSGLGMLQPGQVITLKCQCVVNETYGTQLTNPKDVEIVENTDAFNIIELDGSQPINLADYEGFVVSIKGLKVNSVGKLNTTNNDGAFTIYCTTSYGQEINVRIDGDVNPKLSHSSVEQYATYDVIGGVSKFNDTFQLMLGNKTGAAVNDFTLSN